MTTVLGLRRAAAIVSVMNARWLMLLGVMSGGSVLGAQDCAGLKRLGSANVAVDVAAMVAGGTTIPEAKKVSGLPGFCRVAMTLRPTADSEIRVEVWLPATGWNGKYLALGSGGWGGSIAYDAMADALKRGYATSATDDGHTGGSGSFLLGHPEKLVDFAYRAEHEMAVEAKAAIKAFYGRGPVHSYWSGCSGGGREGLIQAARYPDEFDGIVAGDPANIRRNAWALWLANASFKDAEDFIPPAKYGLIHEAVLKACDALDGLKDGLIENPSVCHPDLKGLLCKGADEAGCLTARQLRTAETILSPANSTAGVELFPRLEPGTEMRWGRLAGGPALADLFLDEFRYVVYKDANWDWRSFDLDRDAAKAHAIDKDVDEMDPRLGAFAKRGGKLLIYHGWADQQVAPGSSVEFYEAAVAAVETPEAKWLRLYMVPGMGHCSGGEGPDSFDKLGALEDWVERGVAPGRIVASHTSGGKVDRTRPLCAYPQQAHYNGSGSEDEAGNFTCR